MAWAGAGAWGLVAAILGGCAAPPAGGGSAAATPPTARWQRTLEPLGERPAALVRERLAAVDAAFAARDHVEFARAAGGRTFLARLRQVPGGGGLGRDVAVLDAVGAEPRVLVEVEAEALEPSPDGSFVAVLVERDDGTLAWQLLDAESGARLGEPLAGVRSKPFEGRTLVWLPGASGLCRVAARGDGLALVHRDFGTGEDVEVWRAPAGTRTVDLRASDDGAQVLAVADPIYAACSAWLVDLYGGPPFELSAALAPPPTDWRAVGITGPLALLLALDPGRGRVVAVDRRRHGAPPLTLATVEAPRVHEACLAGGRLVVRYATVDAPGAPAREALAVHAASGGLERTVDFGPGELLADLRGTAREPLVGALRWAGPLGPHPVLVDPATGAVVDALTGGPPRPAPVERGGTPDEPYRLFDGPEAELSAAPLLAVPAVHGLRYEQLWLALGGAIGARSAWQPAGDPTTFEDVAQRLEELALVPTADAALRLAPEDRR